MAADPPDSDHAGALADILYKHNGEITIDGIYYSFAEDSWYAEKDPEVVAKMVAYLKGAFGLVPQDIFTAILCQARLSRQVLPRFRY